MMLWGSSENLAQPRAHFTEARGRAERRRLQGVLRTGGPQAREQREPRARVPDYDIGR
jgi:hypothetical protein